MGLSACDSFVEPERFVNDDARPPEAGALDFAGLRPGQHVAGVLDLSLDLDSLAGRLDRVEIAIDDGGFGPAEGLPRGFSVQTDAYPDGEHTVRVAIYLKEPRVGLLGVVGAPDYVLSVPLVFDQRPPTPVAVTSVSVGPDRRPRIEWERSEDANFYAYVVERAPVDADGRSVGGETVVEEVYDRETTSLVGAPLPDVYGAGVAVTVRVSNRRTLTERADERPVATYGPDPAPFDLTPLGGGDVARNGDGSELYFVSGPRLVAVSTTTYEETRSLALPGLFASDRVLNSVGVDAETGRLYVAYRATNGTDVLVVDRRTFSVVRTYTLPSMVRPVLAGGRIYGLVSQGALYVVEAATGRVVGQTDEGVFDPRASAVLAASPDGRSVYVSDIDLEGASALIRVDVSGATPRLAARQAIPSVLASAAAVGPDGRVYLATGGAVTSYDGATLRPLESYAPGGDVAAETVLVAGGRVFASFVGGVPLFTFGGTVVELDPESLRPLRSQRLSHAAARLAVGADGRLFAFVPGRAWVLDF